MAAKMTADADTRIITITAVPAAGPQGGAFQVLNVVDDIYEPLKDDWHATPALQRLRFPFRSIGDPKSATSQIGPYVFFNNVAGWRFLPYDGDHELTLAGNLVGESAVAGVVLPIFLPRPGRTIIVPFETSAQALTKETGVSGLDPVESAQLNNINTKTDQIQTDVAQIQIDIGAINTSTATIDGNVATIQTDVGAIKLDISAMQGDLGFVHQMERGKWEIITTPGPDFGKMIFFAADGITPMRTFQLEDAAGNPVPIDPVRRVPL